MTNEEAITRLKAIRSYLTAGNPIWDVEVVGTAMDMAIKALDDNKCLKCLHNPEHPFTTNKSVKTDGDTIRRADAIDALGEEPDIWNDTEEEWAYRNAWVEHISAIKSLPSAEPKTGRDCTDFVWWLMDEVMDEENWQLNAVANGEIICRKLKKLGMLDVKDGYYVETQKTGEWVRKEKEINDCDGRRAYYWYECDNCGAHPPKDQWGHEWHSDFCPNCGSYNGGEEE